MKTSIMRLILSAAVLALAGSVLSGCGGIITPKPKEPNGPSETPLPHASPGLPPAVQQAGLTVEEYPIVEDGIDKPTRFEFLDRVDPQIREKRKTIREAWFRPDVAGMNGTLERFGYQLRIQDQPGAPAPTPGIYSLYKGDILVLSGIRSDDLSSVFVNASGTDWFFLALTHEKGAVMFRSGAVLPWDIGEHLYAPPIYMGDDLLWVEPLDGFRGYRVVKEGQTLYQGGMPAPMVDPAFKRLGAWDGHWAVEVAGDVIVDGASLSTDNGYDEVFHWRLIKGRPFYFYAQGGKVHLRYDGRILDQTYDEVIHYRCCEPAVFNPGANDRMVWFWARRGEMWHYVEAGIYD